MPYVRFAVICLVWGAIFILMKKAGLALGPITIAGLRVLAGAAVLGTLLRWRGAGENVGRRHIWPLLGVAVVGFAIPYTVQPYLVRMHDSGFIGMSISLVPLLTLAVAPLMLGVYPSRRQLIGVVGGLFCMLGMFGDGLDRRVPIAHLALAASVPLSYALTNTYIRKRFAGVNTLYLSTVILAMAAAMLLPTALLCERQPWNNAQSPNLKIPPSHRQVALLASTAADRVALPVPAGPSSPWPALAAVMVLGILGTGLTTFLFNKLVQEQGPLFAGMTTYIVPIGAMLWGWLDNERVTPLQIASLSGILLMVALVQYKAATPQQRPVES